MSHGIILVGLGGSGRSVVDGTLKLLGDWKADGVTVRLIDVIKEDPSAVMSPEPAAIDPGTAEGRFIHSDASCRDIVESARKGTISPQFPWLTKDIAKQVTPPAEGTGAGGDRIASYLIAELGRKKISGSLASAIDTARGQIAQAGRNPTIFVIGGGAGGVGSGHMGVIVEELLEMSNGKVDCVSLMLSGGYADSLFIDGKKRNQAWERAIALQRELDLIEHDAYQMRFIIGGGPKAYADSAPVQGVMAATSLWLASFIRNQSEYFAKRPNWSGTDLKDVPAEARHSTIGAARLSYPAQLVAGWMSRTLAAEAWRLVSHLDDESAEQGVQQARALLQQVSIGGAANSIAGTPATKSVRLAQVDEDAVEELMGVLSPRPDTPQVIDFAANVQKKLPRSCPKSQLFQWCDDYGDELTEELDKFIREGRREWRIQVVELLRLKLDEAFNGDGAGVLIGADAQRLVRTEAMLRAVADTMTAGADRLERACRAIEDQEDPVGKAEDDVEQEAEQLPSTVKRRQVDAYIEARRWLAFCERWRTVSGAAVALMRELAAATTEGAQPLKAWIANFTEFASSSSKAASETATDLRDLDLRPSLTFVPTPDSPAFFRFAEELREEHKASSSDIDATRSSLEELRWTAALPANEPSKWGLIVNTPHVAEHIPAREAWVYNSGTEHRDKASVFAPSFLWEMIEYGVRGQDGMRKVAERYSLYDALAADYRYNFAPSNGDVVEDHLVEQFVAGFRNNMFDNSAPLGPYADSMLEGADAPDPVTNTYYFVDPSAPRRARIEANESEGLGDKIKQALLHDLGTGEQQSKSDGAVREMTRLVVVNGIHTDLFTDMRGHLAHYYVSDQPVHPVPAAATARTIERIAREQRRITERLLDIEVVRLLAYPDTLRKLGQVIALGKLPTMDDPQDPSAAHQLHYISGKRGTRPVDIILGRTDELAEVIISALSGPDADLVRPQIDELYNEAWVEFKDEHEGRDAAREALTEKVWELELGESSALNVSDLELAIGVLATEGA